VRSDNIRLKLILKAKKDKVRTLIKLLVFVEQNNKCLPAAINSYKVLLLVEKRTKNASFDFTEGTVKISQEKLFYSA
jgi:hypothetical protein